MTTVARLLVPDRAMAAALVSLVAGALLPWPVWTLALRVVGSLRAAVAAFAVALHPMLIQYSVITMSESAYVLALYGGLAMAAGGRPGPAGLAIGAGFAIRPEALLPAFALAVRETIRVARRLAAPRGLAFVLVGFLAFAIPCWLYFHATLGRWTATPKVAALRAPAASWQEEERQFRDAEFQLRQAIQDIPDIQQLAQNLIIEQTPEGLRIQIVDQDGAARVERLQTRPRLIGFDLEQVQQPGLLVGRGQHAQIAVLVDEQQATVCLVEVLLDQ